MKIGTTQLRNMDNFTIIKIDEVAKYDKETDTLVVSYFPDQNEAVLKDVVEKIHKSSGEAGIDLCNGIFIREVPKEAFESVQSLYRFLFPFEIICQNYSQITDIYKCEDDYNYVKTLGIIDYGIFGRISAQEMVSKITAVSISRGKSPEENVAELEITLYDKKQGDLSEKEIQALIDSIHLQMRYYYLNFDYYGRKTSPCIDLGQFSNFPGSFKKVGERYHMMTMFGIHQLVSIKLIWSLEDSRN